MANPEGKLVEKVGKEIIKKAKSSTPKVKGGKATTSAKAPSYSNDAKVGPDPEGVQKLLQASGLSKGEVQILAPIPMGGTAVKENLSKAKAPSFDSFDAPNPIPETGLAKIPGRDYSTYKHTNLPSEVKERLDKVTPPAYNSLSTTEQGLYEKNMRDLAKKGIVGEEAVSSLKSMSSGMTPDQAKAFYKTPQGMALIAAGTAGVGGMAYYLSGDKEKAPTPANLEEPPKDGSNIGVGIGVSTEGGNVPPTEAEKKEFKSQYSNYIVEPMKVDDSPLSPPEIPKIDEALKEYAAAVNTAATLYKQEKDGLKRAELWENIVQGVALMAAGMYGLKTGNYATGVKFNSTDWQAKVNSARADMESSISQAKDALNMTDKEIERKQLDFKNKVEVRAQAFRENEAIFNNAFNATKLELEVDSRKVDELDKAEGRDLQRESLDIQREGMNIQKKKAALQLKFKEDDKAGKALKEATKLLYDHSKSPNASDPDSAVRQATIVLQQAGITLPEDMITKTGIFGGKSFKSPDEVQDAILNQLLAGDYQGASAVVVVKFPDGKNRNVPREDVDSVLAEFKGSYIVKK